MEIYRAKPVSPFNLIPCDIDTSQYILGNGDIIQQTSFHPQHLQPLFCQTSHGMDLLVRISFYSFGEIKELHR